MPVCIQDIVLVSGRRDPRFCHSCHAIAGFDWHPDILFLAVELIWYSCAADGSLSAPMPHLAMMHVRRPLGPHHDIWKREMSELILHFLSSILLSLI